MVYNENSIEVLEDREHVRLRPGMWIGSTNEDGIMQLFEEIISNSLDEHIEGYGNLIGVIIQNEDSDMPLCTIMDYGRGIPLGEKDGICAATLAVSKLKAGGKFNTKNYKTSSGLNGVGASCVNFLSQFFNWTVQQNGLIATQSFRLGKAEYPAHIASTAELGSWTQISFSPDFTIFGEYLFDVPRIKKRCEEITRLNPKLRIMLNSEDISHPEGIISFLPKRVGVFTEPRRITEIFTGSNLKELDIVLQWYPDKFDTEIESYVNCGNTVHGGSHVYAFNLGLARAINQDNKKIYQNEDIIEGLKAIISIKMENPIYHAQTKTKLSNKEIVPIVSDAVYKSLKLYFDMNPKVFKALLDKIDLSKKARSAAKRAKDLIRDKKDSSISLPGKLLDAHAKDRSTTEIYLLEGLSPAGHLSEVRNPQLHALLPLKGKIQNCFSVPDIKLLLKNEEILNIVIALGTGIGNDFDITKLRYGKIFIMTDADVDGAHISLLLLGFFEKCMPQLIDEGYIYLTRPPLYRIRDKTDKSCKSLYLKDDFELNNFFLSNKQENYFVSRFKGLGEMQADDLYQTCLDDKYRVITQVVRGDIMKAKEAFNMALSTNSADQRRELIYKKAAQVSWDDFC